MLIFTKFGIDHTNLDFCQQEDAVASINALRVVNDTAERGIHLIKQFNNTTKDEEQKQFLLKIVHQMRKDVPQRTKDALASYQFHI